MRLRIFIIGLACLLWTGCKEEKAVPAQTASGGSAAASAPAASSLPARAESGTPQPKLPVVKLYVGTNEIAAEIASTAQQIQTGMMWRTNMAEMDGMLFVFPQPQAVSFYMRNTLLPLSCGYIDPQGTLLEIYDMKPRDETPLPSASGEIQYVLEMNQGWFQRNNVRTGMVFSTQYGPLPQTFFRRR